jgi:hypothetical protein
MRFRAPRHRQGYRPWKALLRRSTGRKQRGQFILAALEYRRISNASDEMLAIVSKAEEALRLIGSRSRLNAMGMEKYGIAIPAEDEGQGAS